MSAEYLVCCYVDLQRHTRLPIVGTRQSRKHSRGDILVFVLVFATFPDFRQVYPATAIQTEITRTKTEASVLGGEDALIHRLVGQYLAHDGYVETARAFSDEIVDEARALANDQEADIPYRTAVEDLDALNRQSTYILESMDNKTNRIQKYVQRSSRAILTKRSSIRVHTTLRSSVTTRTSTSNSAVGNSSR